MGANYCCEWCEEEILPGEVCDCGKHHEMLCCAALTEWSDAQWSDSNEV